MSKSTYSSSFLAVMAALPFSFPTHFEWCVATAAHQIEGGNIHSDWWQWEQIPGNVRGGQCSGAATGHWDRLAEDTASLSELGVDRYRMSIEWAKLVPAPGQWDESVADHYRTELAMLQARGIRPMITLHHFTFPAWVRERGGWEWDGVEEAFANFASRVFLEIGPHVDDWITVNEPMVHLVLGYLSGHAPPGGYVSDGLKPPATPTAPGIQRFKRALRGLLRSHARVYHELHRLAGPRTKAGSPIRIGLAHHLRVFQPAYSKLPGNIFLSAKLESIFNWTVPDALESGRVKVWFPGVLMWSEEIPGLKGSQDFFGLNYYTRDHVRVNLNKPLGFEYFTPSKVEQSDLGWEIYPEGMYLLLKQIHRRSPGLPIWITENGLADAQDVRRTQFLTTHLSAVARALNEGVPVQGYCHWSLMDNFEWSEGFAPRFGLYAVDYRTQKRTLRESGRFFRDLIKQVKGE